jgi:myxalamid-type polyketide synthase MxaB
MADVYIESMRSVQPGGPYYLVGWSAGGIVAMEVARRLIDDGREVAWLSWIDTPMPSIYEHVDLNDDALFLCDLIDFINRFAGAAMKVNYEELKALDAETRFERVLSEAQDQKVVPPDVSAGYIRHLVDVAKIHVGYIKQYALPAIDTRVHLFRPTEGRVLEDMSGQQLGDDLGWRAVLGDRLQVHPAPGDHFSMMLGENAAHIAAAMTRLVDPSAEGD